MKANMKIICSVCGKTFLPGNTKGLPNGIGYMLQDGTLFNMCAECIIDFGRMADAEKDKFFDEHGIPHK